MIFAALVRHAAYEQPTGVPSAHLLHPLTAEGEAQAHGLADELLALAARLHCVIDTTVHSSPLLRAYQTARIAADALSSKCNVQFEIAEHAALCERSLGACANLSVEEISVQLSRDPRRPALPEDWKTASDFTLPVPGAESLRAAGWRVAQHLQTCMKQLTFDSRPPTLKLFVGHGAAFRHGAYALGLLPLDRVSQLSMYHCQPVVLRHSQDGDFVHVAGAWKERGNETAAD